MTNKEPKPGDSVTIVHPQHGTVHMDVTEVAEDRVGGTVLQEISGYNLPPGRHYVKQGMNFPKTCIKEVYSS
jgi:hypothetical protein